MTNVFLDNWVLERLLEEQSLRARLLPCDRATIRAVVSPWHLYEIGKDGNHERSRRKAILLDELNPLWMKTPLQCRKVILSEELWVHLGLKESAEPLRPFSDNLETAMEEMNGERAPRLVTAAIYVDYLLRYPELLDEALGPVRKWAAASAVVRSNKEQSLRNREIVLRRLIRKELPSTTPAGVQIAERDLDDFSARLDWKGIPLFCLEEALYVAELSWHGELTESDAVDIQYLTGALLYCDAAVVDKRMAELSRRASQGLGFSIARVLREPRELCGL